MQKLEQTFKNECERQKTQTKNKAPGTKLRSQISDLNTVLSLALELRFAFLEEGADALVFVFGRETQGKQIHFAAEPFVQV